MPIKDEIQATINKNDVVLFMKGTPDFPQCGFSGRVVQILHSLGVSYEPVDCLASDEIRQGSRNFPTGRPSLSFTSRANSSAAATLSGKCSNRANSRRIWRIRVSPASNQPRHDFRGVRYHAGDRA
jgi:Glutaredoxin